MTLIERLKQEFITGWKPFEVIWLALFYRCADLGLCASARFLVSNDFWHFRYFVCGISK